MNKKDRQTTQLKLEAGVSILLILGILNMQTFVMGVATFWDIITLIINLLLMVAFAFLWNIHRQTED